jgi:hypothetical protein
VEQRFLLLPGQARSFTVAGLGVRFESEMDEELELPPTYEAFESHGTREDLVFLVGAREELEPPSGAVLYDSGVHWRVFEPGQRIVFEILHPPTSRVWCQAHVDRGFHRAHLLFGESAWRSLWGAVKQIPHPLDQLLFAPRLALQNGFLLHASGAVVEGRAHVFAGHSGDGKTTLARLLEAEGASLMSDERIAIRETRDGFVAYGTPWSGEGNVAAAVEAPLDALYLLEKSPVHEVRRAGSTALTEVLSRAIVPGYLPGTISRILDVFASLATRVSLRELHFAREAGLASLLRAASRPDLAPSLTSSSFNS